MRIAIASDHLGFELKTALIEHLRSKGHECDDLGAYTKDPEDYPDIAERLALQVADGTYPRGILICGTGIGMAITANKVPGIRAAQVHDSYSAERARMSNDAQIMTLGAQVVGGELAKQLVDIWIRSEFSGGRSTPKVDKIKAIDRKYRTNPTNEGSG
jgi:ribose 5-phosphate isomerase B